MPHFKLLAAVLVLGCSFLRADVNQVPAFTPNVVDSTQTLSAEDVAEINQRLQLVRDKAGIWGAVYLVQELRDDSIESLAERAFKKWTLGAKGKDNGLLLVLAMKDRRSRFEVGYGLEGDLPDAITRRALDDVLRPHMRQGDVKTAIVKSFSYLAAVKSKDPAFEADSIPPAAEEDRDLRSQGLNVPQGKMTLLFYLACLWLLRPLVQTAAIGRARRLAESYPAYDIVKDSRVNQGRYGFKNLFVGQSMGSAFLRVFFSINPGVFLFFAGALHPLGFAAVMIVCLLVAVSYFRTVTGRYASVAAYEAFIAAQRKRNQRLVDKGYMQEKSPGQFEYTPAWYSSSEYRSSRSSSSSSSSSSRSSSGGGRSGGGGSSSSW